MLIYSTLHKPSQNNQNSNNNHNYIRWWHTKEKTHLPFFLLSITNYPKLRRIYGQKSILLYTYLSANFYSLNSTIIIIVISVYFFFWLFNVCRYTWTPFQHFPFLGLRAQQAFYSKKSETIKPISKGTYVLAPSLYFSLKPYKSSLKSRQYLSRLSTKQHVEVSCKRLSRVNKNIFPS